MLKGVRARRWLMGVSVLACSALASAASATADVSAAEAARSAFAPTATRTLPARGPVTTTHQLKAGSLRMPYRTIVSEWPVQSPAGATMGVVVTEAYVATGPEGDGQRPVTFIYNGGPGSSSWALQMEGLGPKVYDAQRGAFRDNPDTLLDASDLVFIDPLGTGASFPLQGVDASSAWNTPGDARTLGEVIAGWLKANGRSDSPQFLLGESYGTLRTLAILHDDTAHPRLHIQGVMLLSLYLNSTEGADLEAIALLPSLAASAQAHGSRPLKANSAEEAYADARQFAHSTYASALLEGSALSDEALHQVATQLMAQTGIPADTWVAHHLQLDRKTFSHALALPDQEHTGVLDARVTGGPELDRLPVPYDDPSMSLGRRSPQLMERYLAGLGYRVAGPYRPLNLTINREAWYYTAPPTSGIEDTVDAVPWLVEAMQAHPAMRLFTAGGIFDANTPVANGVYLLDHADIDRTRWTAKAYPAGHGITEDEAQRAALAKDLRAFIRGGGTASTASSAVGQATTTKPGRFRPH